MEECVAIIRNLNILLFSRFQFDQIFLKQANLYRRLKDV